MRHGRSDRPTPTASPSNFARGPATRRSPRALPRLLLVAVSALGISCDSPFADLALRILGAPTAVMPGSEVQIDHRVCNRGEEPAGPTDVALFARPVEPPGPDVSLGLHPVPPLEPGACHTGQTLATAPYGPEGAYRLFGVVDPQWWVEDPRRANNSYQSEIFGIGYAADLVVTELSAPPSVMPYDVLEVGGEVCNRGFGWSGPVELAVFLSEDDAIDVGPPAPDWYAGNLSLPDLGPGECAPVEGDLLSSGPEGVFHVAAVVDPGQLVTELVESNNARVGGALGVGYGPDLVVSAISGPPSVHNWSSFEVEAEVCNVGTMPSGDTWASVHFSANPVIVPSHPDPASGDPMLGGFPVPPLMPGECVSSREWVHANVPLEGAWYLGAYVDDAQLQPELVESNNGRAGTRMGVGYAPDLVVRGLAGPPSAGEGSAFDAEVEACNQGTAPSGPSSLRLFLSSDLFLEAEPAGGDPVVGDHPLPPLDPGACHVASVPAWAHVSEPGPHFLVARLDAYQDVPELIEFNNVHFGPLLGVGHLPDLVVTALGTPPSAFPGGAFQASATVCNQGTVPSGPTQVGVYLSGDANIQGMYGPPAGPAGYDGYAGDLQVPDLFPGGCAQVSGELYAYAPDEGAFHVGAIVDEVGAIDELIEANNVLVGDQMGVGSLPDLVLTHVEGPASAHPGQEISLDFRVCNQGTTMTGPAPGLRFYASTDAVIEGYEGGPPVADHYVGEVSIPDLYPGECHDGALLGPAPFEEGVHFVGGIADEPDALAELIETNNVALGNPIGIGLGPDLFVSRLEGDPSAMLGGPFDVEAEVCNQGTSASSFSVLALYLSRDAQVDGAYHGPGDPVLVDVPVPDLAPGACHVEGLEVWANVPEEGAWHLAAIVDEGQYLVELIETNNDFVGGVVGVGSRPDLVVTSVSAPPSVPIGAPFDVTAEVCNQGTVGGTHGVLAFYLSEDEILSSVLEGPPGPDSPLGGPSIPDLAPGQCETLVTSLGAFAPHEGPWYLGAIADEGDALPELLETNNTRIGPQLEVTLP